jgi:CRP/FNR family transcriptional regulator
MKTQFEQPLCDKCNSRLNNVFCNLTLEQISEMTLEKNCSMYKKGQILFNEGNRPNGMYCINKGKIKLFQTCEDGREQILRLAKEGDVLGYRSLISGDPYSASATAMEDAVVCFIPKSLFFDFLHSNSDFSSTMMQLLSHDLKVAEHQLTAIAHKPVRERMAEAILMLKEFYGTDEEGLINTVVLREDIASIIGTATETAIRILSEFKSEKLIGLEGKKIRVLNHNGLIKAAHIYD